MSPSYRLGDELEKEATKIIKEYIADGVIRESSSPWRSPIVLVKKKNGEYRLCVDYRRLNEVTVKDSYPMPLIDDILNAMRGAKYFTKLDALSGYHQIDMHEEDVEKTAFSCKDGLFEFVKMPFGLVNAPATFQRAMNRVLKPYNGQFVRVYMDDIIIYSNNKEEHEKHVKKVMKLINQAGIKLNKEKCEFGKSEIKILGHVIDRNGIRIDPNRIQAIKQLEIPRSRKELESFLGMIQYCSKFINNLTEDNNYLYSLIRKDANVKWKDIISVERYVNAIEALKKRIEEAGPLAIPSKYGKFILTTDVSDCGIGAILSQIQDGKKCIVSYFSKAHSKAEKNYSTTEKELLAVIRSVKHFRHFLLGRKFLLKTDHSAIKYLFKSRNVKTKFARWALYL